MKELCCILLFFPFSALGQKVFQNIEDYSFGDKSLYLQVSGFDSSKVITETKKSGSNIVWNFDQFRNISDTFKQIIVRPDSTSYKDIFPKANTVEKNSDGSLVFTQLKKDSSIVWGYVDDRMQLHYTDPLLFITRPFAYKDSVSDFFERSYKTYGIQYKGTGTASSVADGWGKLIIQGMSFDSVLRIKFQQVSKDVSQADNSVMEIANTTYAWFSPKYNKALLKIDLITVSSPYYSNSTLEMRYLCKENGKLIFTK